MPSVPVVVNSVSVPDCVKLDCVPSVPIVSVSNGRRCNVCVLESVPAVASQNAGSGRRLLPGCVPGASASEQRSKYDHLNCVIENLPESISVEDRNCVIELLHSYHDIFSRSEFDVGCTNLMTASVLTGDHPPIAQSLRRYPRAHLDLIDDTVDEMCKADICSESVSAWNFNIVMVNRPGQKVPRVTLDLRSLNNVSYKDRFPLPKIRDCLDALQGNGYFSCLDISNSFNNIPIRQEDRDKISFSTRKGQFSMNRLPQGYCNSSSIFSRLMALVLRGLPIGVCNSFIDDIIVLGRTARENIDNLALVFKRLREAGLKIKPKKVKLLATSVKYLGFVVSAEGIAVCEDRVACVRDWKYPTCITELRRFLGFANYHRMFIESFSAIAEPLNAMLRKEEQVVPTPERLESFERLKVCLTTTPVLALPCDVGSYVVDTDASSQGLGCCLSQYQEGVLRPIEFASRSLNPCERHYCSTRLELLGFIFALKQFRHYLIGTPFQVRVDNMALTFLLKTPEPSGQTARYLDLISQYDFSVVYRPGRNHINCDVLSRLRPCEENSGEPCAQCSKRITGVHTISALQARPRRSVRPPKCLCCEPGMRHQEVRDAGPPQEEIDERMDATAVAPELVVPPQVAKPKVKARAEHVRPMLPTFPVLEDKWSSEELSKAQAEDPDVSQAVEWCRLGARPDWELVKGDSPYVRALHGQFESLVMRDEVLYRSYYNAQGRVTNYQLVLPGSLKSEFLTLIHCDLAGHLKVDRCVPAVQQRAWWVSWRQDLKLFITCCAKCAAYTRSQAPKQGLLHPMVHGDVNDRWHLDLTGRWTPCNGYVYILTAVEAFSRYCVCVPLRNKESLTVAKAIMDHIVMRFGIPLEFSSDQGLEFNAELSHSLMRFLGINKVRTTAYRPQANSLAEKIHLTLNSMMAKVVSEHQKDWCMYLPYVAFSYNATVHSATGFTPNFIMFGRELHWRVDLLLGASHETQEEHPLPEYVAEVQDRIEYAHSLVRENLRKNAVTMKTWYDRRVSPKRFVQGDRVLCYSPRRYMHRSPKWQSFYGDKGVIVQRLNDVSYVVHCDKWRHDKVVHVDKLKLIQEFNA